MDGSEVDDCFETIDPPTGVDDELNSKFYHVDCRFTFEKGLCNSYAIECLLRSDDPLRFYFYSTVLVNHFKKNCYSNMI